jgi:riboflavin kinase/FMN adenylyltransferase
MQRWQGLHGIPEGLGRSILTIGVFDGVHRGHQRIIGHAAKLARRRGLPAVVVTFDPHPDEVIRPGSHPPMLCTVRRRTELLAGLGADAVCTLAFTREFSELSAEDFVREVLAERLHAAGVVVGENFRFGHRARGDLTLLTALGSAYDFTAAGVPLLSEAGRTISSSGIRQLLAAGDVGAAAADLGRPHRVEGIVARGQRRGRALGFPTANVEPPQHTALPADAIYAGWLTRLSPEGAEGDRWPAAISVGMNVTFGGQDRTVEAYALDRDDLDLYGDHVAVDFVRRLRGMARFASADELVAQMRQDVTAARAALT